MRYLKHASQKDEQNKLKYEKQDHNEVRAGDFRITSSNIMQMNRVSVVLDGEHTSMQTCFIGSS